MKGLARATRRGRVRGVVFLAVVLAALVTANTALAQVSQRACDRRNNNTYQKLTECIRLDQVRAHQAALQAIADANGGNRFSGRPGYDRSVDYVVGKLQAAGYNVTVQPFNYLALEVIGPSTLQQTAPGSNTSTSGCEAADFAGFPAGNIALLQRGTCTFEIKAENAAAAGAVGIVIFNQGNLATPDRRGIPAVTLTANNTSGIPVLGTTYPL